MPAALPLPSPPCSAPTVAFTGETAVGVKAMVAPPADGDAWSYYTLAVCQKDASPATCLPGSPFNCPKTGASTACDISGAQAQTTYTVVARAFEADGTPSALSASAFEFTTLQHP